MASTLVVKVPCVMWECGMCTSRIESLVCFVCSATPATRIQSKADPLARLIGRPVFSWAWRTESTQGGSDTWITHLEVTARSMLGPCPVQRLKERKGFEKQRREGYHFPCSCWRCLYLSNASTHSASINFQKTRTKQRGPMLARLRGV